ncbi:MAG: hypothetical protein SLRJCFUN_000293 [Candidatus Fervidibacter sp.]|jgi:hypothetical protein
MRSIRPRLNFATDEWATLRAGDGDAPTALVAHFLRLCHRLTAVLVVVSKRPAFPVERTVAVCRLAMDLNGDGIRAMK